jgi:hypothetical protein
MKYKYFYLVVCGVLFFSCTDKTLEPINENMGKPGVVTELEITCIPGGAIVNYRIPDAADLLSVKAVYTITNGNKRESIASYYDNQLVLEGFSDTLQHEAKIYAVSRAQVLSDPVTVTFSPLVSSLVKTAKTAQIFSDFGGATFTWQNEDEAPLTFDLQTTNAKGEWLTATIIQSSAESAEKTIRGYLPEPRQFRLVVSDNWDNQLIILPEETIIPLPENRLDKTIMSFMNLGFDTFLGAWGGKDVFLIDDDLNSIAVTYAGIYPRFTIDLGKKTKLSRIVMHQRMYDAKFYNQCNVRLFEVQYPLVETPSQSGVTSEWAKAMDCEVVKPSGMPYAGDGGNIIDYTVEDMKAAQDGHSFNFPREMNAVRYVRVYVAGSASLWNKGANLGQFAEFTFYGQYVE